MASDPSSPDALLERASALRELIGAFPNPSARAGLLRRIEAVVALAREGHEGMADAAERKAAQAAQDRERKRRPYEADPLFMYLWRRGYGTSAYEANPLARALDGKVARLVGYEAARVNYALLLALPDRLAEHAARLRAEAAAGGAAEALAALDQDPEVRGLLAEAAARPELASVMERAAPRPGP